VSRAWELFASQPTRWLVRCFTLAGNNLRCFLIDRSGAFASENVDIHKNPDLTLQALYHFFCEEDVGELGFDKTIFIDRLNKSVPYDPTAHSQQPLQQPTYILTNDQLPLYICLTDPLCYRTCLFSRGTRLWRARRQPDGGDFDMVVKDSWRYSERQSE